MRITLYKQGARGEIREWSIYDSALGEVIIEWGVVGGTISEIVEDVPEGKAGRTLEEQIASRINSRVKKQLDRGYVHTIEEARSNSPTNALGLARPMLAQTFDKAKNVDFVNSKWQFKYNGHRCLVTMQDSKLIAYSRNGKRIDTIPEILDSISIGEGMTLDGELYMHGTPLQSITSYVRRRQERTKDLIYVVYDIILDDSFSDRYKVLQSLQFKERVVVASAIDGFEPGAAPLLLSGALSAGYEGLIVRLDGYGYEDGKRSKSLLKVKSFFDKEFLVKDIIPSREGWGIAQCMTEEGKLFYVSTPGSVGEREGSLLMKDKLIGKMLTVKYAELTEDGIPFHPVATNWRSDL
jgi:DNA ligase-1